MLFALACCGSAAAQQTIWPGTTVPATLDNGASGPLELGVSFKSDVSGTITGIRFYKSSANTGTHMGRLWGSNGALLASVTFTGETASGWQQANFSTPVTIAANTVYVASYGLTIGHFSANWSYFATSAYNNIPLHALQTPNGVYGTLGSHPTATHQAANYWVDVVFKSASSTAPSITSQPTGRTVVAGQTASFSVVATGTATLSYQWMKNSVAISAATSSSYTTPATTTADNGELFTVAVSNSLGKVTSSAATLTVSASTLALTASPTSLSFGSIDTGSTSTLGVTLKNTGNFSITISGVSASAAGVSTSNVSSNTVLAAGQSAALNVTFAPTSTGGVTGTVTVTSNATNSPATISVSGTGVQSNFSTWVAPSLNRVGKTDAPGTLSSIVLSGARGETVDTQVVVQGPGGALTNVNVAPTALKGPNGVTIPVSNVTLYREYYLSVTGTASYGGGTNPPLGSGTYADPLIPFNDPGTRAALFGSSAPVIACNAVVRPGQNSPYWM